MAIPNGSSGRSSSGESHPSWQTVLKDRVPSYELDQPLEVLDASFPAKSTDVFCHRLWVFLSAFRMAVAKLDRAVSSGQNKELELAATTLSIVMTAWVLQAAYASHTTQPFRAELLKGIEVVKKAAQKASNDSLEPLLGILGVLVAKSRSDLSEVGRRSVLDSLQLSPHLQSELRLDSLPQLHTLLPASKTDPRSLLKAACFRTLQLSEARSLLDDIAVAIDQDGPTVDIAAIASHNSQVAERILLELAVRTANHSQADAFSRLEQHLRKLGADLAVNDSRSLDLVVRLVQSDASVMLGPDEARSPYRAPLRLLCWSTGFLAQCLSRCFADLSQRERTRLDTEENEEEELNTSSVHEETARDLERLLAFARRSYVYEVARSVESAGRTLCSGGHHLEEEHSNGASSALIIEEEVQRSNLAADAVLVEIQSFALEMARYREAAALLRWLTTNAPRGAS